MVVKSYDGEDAQILILPSDSRRTAEYFARKLRSQDYIFAVFTEDEVRRAARALH
jgi:hypothetical protein